MITRFKKVLFQVANDIAKLMLLCAGLLHALYHSNKDIDDMNIQLLFCNNIEVRHIFLNEIYLIKHTTFKNLVHKDTIREILFCATKFVHGRFLSKIIMVILLNLI